MAARICVCRYPLMITDKRFGDDIVHISMPLEVIKGMSEMPIPDMEVIDEKGFDDIVRKYMMVRWQESFDESFDISKTKRYNIQDHIVIAGCPEDQLKCDIKSIYTVYHPMDEWNSYHMLELK